MFAKTLLAIEPELVGGVVAVDAGFQRVAVAAGAQPLQHVGDQRRCAGLGERRVGAHLRRQRHGARVAERRQGGVGQQCIGALQRSAFKTRVAFGPVTQQVADRAVHDPLQFGRLHWA